MDQSQFGTSLVSFLYENEGVRFQGCEPDEHIINVMLRNKTFYEIDVLEAIKRRVKERRIKGAALDIGAFIGTHSVFFSQFCGLEHVFSYEPNPITFAVLKENITINNLDNVNIYNKGLGCHAGLAHIVQGPVGDGGMSKVQPDNKGTVELSTIDIERKNHASILDIPVGLIKIDVEGFELEVIAGGRDTIELNRPLICVEVHSGKTLYSATKLLEGYSYLIVDCRGYSPTYLMETSEIPYHLRKAMNLLWVFAAFIPSSRIRSFVRQPIRTLQEVLRKQIGRILRLRLRHPPG